MYGDHVHKAVLRAGVSETGCTIHLVSSDLDAGRIVHQRACPVNPGDTVETLAARVFAEECEAMPEAIRMMHDGMRASLLTNWMVPIGTTASEERAKMLRQKISEHLDDCVDECVIPELGEATKGKVRDIYMVDDKVMMITNDRVSAFDFVLPNLIPFKGRVLNAISKWAMAQTADILPNPLCDQPDPNVVVQKKMKNLMIEAIVRGYLWGSMAAAYEKGERVFCGLKLPEGMTRYQKLAEPLFTPTTKAEVGHDENMTMDDVAKKVGPELAKQVKDVALKLYARGVEVMRKRGLILLDTKYEFGLDENGKLYVIDEVNTPDSSRMCSIAEYETKWPRIQKEGLTPELKIKEFSKQYVRDTLLELGFDGTKALKLPPNAVVECAYRYISVYEQITGEKFEFPETQMRGTMGKNLQAAGLISAGCVAIFAGSDSDKAHMDKLAEGCSTYGLPVVKRICSALTEALTEAGGLEEILQR